MSTQRFNKRTIKDITPRRTIRSAVAPQWGSKSDGFFNSLNNPYKGSGWSLEQITGTTSTFTAPWFSALGDARYGTPLPAGYGALVTVPTQKRARIVSDWFPLPLGSVYLFSANLVVTNSTNGISGILPLAKVSLGAEFSNNGLAQNLNAKGILKEYGVPGEGDPLTYGPVGSSVKFLTFDYLPWASTYIDDRDSFSNRLHRITGLGILSNTVAPYVDSFQFAYMNDTSFAYSYSKDTTPQPYPHRALVYNRTVSGPYPFIKCESPVFAYARLVLDVDNYDGGNVARTNTTHVRLTDVVVTSTLEV